MRARRQPTAIHACEIALKATGCIARRLLPVQPVYFTSSHWETRSHQARARPGSPASRLFVPITMATSWLQQPFADYFSAAGSCMNSAVHVPPSPCLPVPRRTGRLISHQISLSRSLCPGWGHSSLAHTHRSRCPGAQLTAWHTQAKALPCHSWVCWQLHREAVSGFKRVPKTFISRPGRADPAQGGDSKIDLDLPKGQS